MPANFPMIFHYHHHIFTYVISLLLLLIFNWPFYCYHQNVLLISALNPHTSISSPNNQLISLLHKAPSMLEEISVLGSNSKKKESTKSLSLIQIGIVDGDDRFKNVMMNSKFRSIKSLKKMLSSIRFDCKAKPEGYYADIDFECRIFHYCKNRSLKFTFACPGSSIFNQKELACENNLNDSWQTCLQSENYFFLNSVIYTNDSNNNGNKSYTNHKNRKLFTNRTSESTIIKKQFKTSTIPVPKWGQIGNMSTIQHPQQYLQQQQQINRKVIFENNNKFNDITMLPSNTMSMKYSVPRTNQQINSVSMTTKAPLVTQIDKPNWFIQSSAKISSYDKLPVNRYSLKEIQIKTIPASVESLASTNKPEIISKFSTSKQQQQQQILYSASNQSNVIRISNNKAKPKTPLDIHIEPAKIHSKPLVIHFDKGTIRPRIPLKNYMTHKKLEHPYDLPFDYEFLPLSYLPDFSYLQSSPNGITPNPVVVTHYPLPELVSTIKPNDFKPKQKMDQRFSFSLERFKEKFIRNWKFNRLIDGWIFPRFKNL